jgi:hypothetical protein
MSALGTELLWRYPSGRTVDYTREELAERIRVLHKKGQLSARGNLSDWRHSEVKLVE